MKKSRKDFDCVQMKNEIQKKIYTAIKDMSSDELIAYFANGAKRYREKYLL